MPPTRGSADPHLTTVSSTRCRGFVPAATLIDPASNAPAGAPGFEARSRWAFVGSSSLPADPAARRAEQRGRRWLVLSYILCPCHLRLNLALIGTGLGGTAFGARIGANRWAVGAMLTALWVLVLWRGFHQIRRANALEASETEPGYRGACLSGACAPGPAVRRSCTARQTAASVLSDPGSAAVRMLRASSRAGPGSSRRHGPRNGGDRRWKPPSSRRSRRPRPGPPAGRRPRRCATGGRRRSPPPRRGR